MNQKKILITNKGYVPTSRGMCITPITRPYKESVDVILRLITRYNAQVEEVLDNGEHLKLDISNYANDNNVKPIPVMKVPDKIVAPVVTNPEPTNITVENNNGSRPLSRKERRRMEHDKRRAEQQAAINDNSQEQVLNIVEKAPENVTTSITDSQVTELDEVPVE